MNIIFLQKFKLQHGFSLLEILIVLAIISILSAVAIPSYTHYLTKAHRLEAEITLIKIAGILEKYYISHNTYQNAEIQALVPAKQKNYRFELTMADDADFILTAHPLAEQEIRDVECGTLTLTAKGEKSISGSNVSAECW